MFETCLDEQPVANGCGVRRVEVLVREAQERRGKAEAVLESLLEAKAECDRQLARFRRSDAFKELRGDSAIERAIESTRGMIESLDRYIADVTSSRQPEPVGA